ncbi:hypothetical protein MN608_00201 [Microdochium nivale]|nr:hypothetical protein MN608_00201 [Microdochium nivale]
MMRPVTLAAAAGLVGGALARTSSVGNMFLPGFNGQGLVARVLSADATATEYFVECDASAGHSPCRVGNGATVTMHPPHSYAFNIADGDHFTLEEQCTITADTAECTWSADGEAAQATGATTSTMTAIASSDFFVPVTITGGWAALQTHQIELRQALDQCLTNGITGVTETDFPTPTGKPETQTQSTRPGGTQPTGTSTGPGQGAAAGLERPAAAAVAALAGLGALALAL